MRRVWVLITIYPISFRFAQICGILFSMPVPVRTEKKVSMSRRPRKKYPRLREGGYATYRGKYVRVTSILPIGANGERMAVIFVNGSHQRVDRSELKPHTSIMAGNSNRDNF